MSMPNVLAQTGGNIRMSFGENVGVHTEGDLSGDAALAGPFGQQRHLGFALYVENQNAGGKCKIDLFGGLAHSGKHHPASGLLFTSRIRRSSPPETISNPEP